MSNSYRQDRFKMLSSLKWKTYKYLELNTVPQPSCALCEILNLSFFWFTGTVFSMA